MKPQKKKRRWNSTIPQGKGTRQLRNDPGDEKCRQEVFDRDGGVCQVKVAFGATDCFGPLDWSHIYGRNTEAGVPLRQDPRGSMAHCRGHNGAAGKSLLLGLDGTAQSQKYKGVTKYSDVGDEGLWRREWKERLQSS